MGMPECCLPAGFARRLRGALPCPEVLLGVEWCSALLQTAYAIRLGNAGIELRHAWNRRHATSSTGLPSFVSDYINYEALFLLRARQQIAQQEDERRSFAQLGDKQQRQQQQQPQQQQEQEQQLLQ